MPINSELSLKIFNRYAWCRDNGHTDFVLKADKCDRFFRGDQWEPSDLTKLKQQSRPALTINKILPTVSNIMGEQINSRAETSFRPRSGSPSEIADVLNKVFRQISDNNQIAFKRSEMFADGVITGRGFLDLRLGFKDSMQGEAVIESLNPKNVVIGPDGEDYDPDTWDEVFITKWVTADDIAALYSPKDAKLLGDAVGLYGLDSVQIMRDRFGENNLPAPTGDFEHKNVIRNIRLIERQYRMLDRQKHFVSKETGDMREIPKDFTRDRIAFYVEKFGFGITTKLVRRIRWTCVADNVVLHDDWSPYKHFTVIPYFPHFRRGHTVGLVENLLGSQELLNKTTSQELHIVNTTANSGYIVRTGALVGMTASELEQKGAQTGLVIEVNGEGAIDQQITKITPNAVPSGLDRVSYKAEEHLKVISGVSDSMQGFDREDVAAKAIQEKKKAGSTNLVKPFDNLTRSDYILARNTLDLVQEYYTEERLMSITHDQVTGESESFTINQMTPEGVVANDLTVGEYQAVVTSVPARESMEDSQFEQAMSLRELGIQIPDAVLIDASRLMNKKDIMKQIEAASASPEAVKQRQTAQRGADAEVAKTEAEAASKHADAGLKGAKTVETQEKARVIAEGEPDDGAGQAKMAEAQTKHAVADHAAGLEEKKFARDTQFQAAEQQRKNHKDRMDAQIKEADLEAKREDARVEAARQAAAAALHPETQGVPQ